MSAPPLPSGSSSLVPLSGDYLPLVAALLPQVMSIENAVYDYPWTEGVFNGCLRAGYYCSVVRDTDDRVVAYAVMSVAAGESHLLNVCVIPGVRRRGVGGMLVEHMISEAERQQAEVVFLEVRPSNIGALQLYRDLGFVEVGLRSGYYPAPAGREDALVMALALGDQSMFSE